MTSRLGTAVAVILGVATLGGWLALLPFAMPYTTDSAAYIETANAVRRGEGFAVTTYGVHPVEVDRQPLDLFPPGYPLLIAAVSALGLAPAIGALALQGLAIACLPLLFFRILRRLVDPGTALLTALACTWTSAVVMASLCVWSDVPCLGIALLSLDVFFIGLAAPRPGVLLAAGLLAGCACLTRNVAYALVAAELFGVCAAGLAGAWPMPRVGRMIAVYLAGVVGGYGWWLARNLVVFGRMQPYDMAPSEIGAGAALAQAAHALATSVLPTSSRSAALVVLLVLGLVIAWVTVSGLRILLADPTSTAHRQRALVWATLAAYALAGVALVVTARARYRWGEPIGDRHLLQYLWILIAAGAGAIATALTRWERRVAALVGVACLAGGIGLQARPVRWQLAYTTAHSRPELERMRAFAPVVAARVPPEALVASNVAPLLRILTDRPVRQINEVATPESLRRDVTPTRELYLALVPCETFCRGLYPSEAPPLWLDDDAETIAAAGYEVVYREGGGALLRAARR